MENNKDSKMLLLQCIGNTCKLINVGKCPNAQPITNPSLELPINTGVKSLPDLDYQIGLNQLMIDDEE